MRLASSCMHANGCNVSLLAVCAALGLERYACLVMYAHVRMCALMQGAQDTESDCVLSLSKGRHRGG